MRFAIEGYRCFGGKLPTEFDIEPGFTALLGPNNSGKSTVLKLFVEFRSLFELLEYSASDRFGHFQGDGVRLEDRLSALAISKLANSVPLALEVDLPSSGGTPDSIRLRLEFRDDRFAALLKRGGQVFESVLIGDETLSFDRESMPLSIREAMPLSTLRDAMKHLRRCMYVGSFRNALQGSSGNHYDLRIGSTLCERWRDLKTGLQSRQNELAVELEQEIAVLFGVSRLTLNTTPDGRNFRIVVNGRSYDLSEVGSGLAHAICVLVNIAFEKPSFVAIDEPETGLHPALQIAFLNAVAKHTETGTVVFSTHSLGLARSVANSLYSVRQASDGISTIETFGPSGSLAEQLGSMSYGSLREVGYDRVLLVEGVTDAQVIRQWLRKIDAEAKFVLLPLGGSALINGQPHVKEQLAEITRISDRVFALVDSENEGKGPHPDREAFRKVCQELQIRCHLTERRATENYLTQEAIQKIKGPKYSALTQYQSLKDQRVTWGKNENWRIAAEMRLADFRDTDIGIALRDFNCGPEAVAEGKL